MSEMDQNVAVDEVTASAASAAANVEDDAEGISVDADNDASSDDDDGVEVIGEDDDYYDEDEQMTTAPPTHGAAGFHLTTNLIFSLLTV